MRRFTILILMTALASVAGWLGFRGPKTAPPSNVVIKRTPERHARGKHLFETVMDCDGCHSERDLSRFSAPLVAGSRGVGNLLPKELGLPGKIVARNITQDRQTGLGEWTDGEIIRAIREGVSRDGRALFPMMPYQNYVGMSDEDVFSLVAYLRTLAPRKNELPPTRIDFPVNLLIVDVPKPAGLVAGIDRGDTLALGRYLVRLGGCQTCHTRMEKGTPVEGKEFGGDEIFRLGGYEVRSANISPDVDTGIGSWNENRFIEKFKNYASFNEHNLPPAVQANFTLMPWLALRNLEEEELKAIYAYLRTVKPVRQKVDVHPLL